MKISITITVLLSICWKHTSGQFIEYEKIQIDEVLIETGEFSNYYAYDLGDFIFYNGRYENNLTFKIVKKESQQIVYSYRDSISDAMIHIPMFFSNDKRSKIVILVEVAAESSWGQEVLLISKGIVNYLGYLNYTIDNEIGESISEYCHITEQNNKMILGFEDISIICWDENAKRINGKELKFELGMDGIRKVK